MVDSKNAGLLFLAGAILIGCDSGTSDRVNVPRVKRAGCFEWVKIAEAITLLPGIQTLLPAVEAETRKSFYHRLTEVGILSKEDLASAQAAAHSLIDPSGSRREMAIRLAGELQRTSAACQAELALVQQPDKL